MKVCKGQYIDYEAELIKSKYRFWSTEKHKNHKDKNQCLNPQSTTIEMNTLIITPLMQLPDVGYYCLQPLQSTDHYQQQALSRRCSHYHLLCNHQLETYDQMTTVPLGRSGPVMLLCDRNSQKMVNLYK